MAVKKKRRRHRHYTGGSEGDISELSARLAPLEEQNKTAVQQVPSNGGATQQGSNGHGGGAIVVNTGSLNLPKNLEGGEKKSYFLDIEPVVIVILALALAFIAFIAWQISLIAPPAQ